MFALGRRIIVMIILCSLLQGCASALRAERLQSGKLTFEAGDFKKAFCQLLPLAVDGRVEAEYAVGYMYYYGYGVPADDISGEFWIKRSAKHGYFPALQALKILQQKEKSKQDNLEPTAPIKTHPETHKKSATYHYSENNGPYTLQLLGSYDVSLIKKLQTKFKWKNPVYCYQSLHHSRDWFILTYGNYTAMYEAKLALYDLPQALKKYQPWVRGIGKFKKC